MTILDRMLFVSFIRAFCICLVSTLSLYIIVDLFTNIDAFADRSEGLVGILQNIAGYYGYRSLQFADRLSEIIVLLAAMFTIAWMQRSNELLPLLSAGVSTHRVLRPIFIGAMFMFTLSAINQEFIIPTIADELLKDRDDPRGEREVYVAGVFDPSGVQIEGIRAQRKDMSVEGFFVVLPETPSSSMCHLSSEKAYWVPPQEGVAQSGGWLLTKTTPAVLEKAWKHPAIEPARDPGRYFLKVKECDFAMLTRNPKWFGYASTEKLYEMLDKSEGGRLAPIAVTFHMRITRPLVSMLLVVMGLAMILRDQTRPVFISAGMCLVVCALFYLTVFGCRFMGNAEFLPPALAAWAPILVFGPFAFSFYDAMHT